jgi:superfamily II DNA or RNA helicase
MVRSGGTHTMIKLRDYQTDAISAVHAAWERGQQRPAVVLPTGSGKTVIFSHMASWWGSWAARDRTLILVHRDELADQTLAKLAATDDGLDIGKVKAADDQVNAQVVVASVQTLARPARLARLLATQTFRGRFGLVIVDECHHAVAQSYKTVMRGLGCYDGCDPIDLGSNGTVAVGFTATLARGDGQGLGNVWDDVVYSKSVLWMIRQGYLADVRGKAVDAAELDLSGVKRSGGDYQAKDLGAAMLEADAQHLIVQAAQQYAADRRSLIVFVPTVAMAEETAAAMDAAGMPAGLVHGGTPRDERRTIYRRFKDGELRAVVNCMVLTEGADFPWADCAVIARPTSNPVLYVQMVGRVLRPYPGKTDALVLNVGTDGQRLATLVDLSGNEVHTARDSESLTEAADRESDEAEQRVSAGSKAFRLKHREVNLFGASDHVWLRTDGGVLFVPAGEGLIFLWPSEDGEDLWDVCRAWTKGRHPWERLHTGLELGMAQAWAETEADDYDDFNIRKTASWRRTKASPQQVAYAQNLKRDITDDMRKGEVSDAISVGIATKMFDRFLRRMK